MKRRENVLPLHCEEGLTGDKCIQIAYSSLSAKENEMLPDAIDAHREFINEQISKTFRGEKTKIKDLEK